TETPRATAEQPESRRRARSGFRPEIRAGYANQQRDEKRPDADTCRAGPGNPGPAAGTDAGGKTGADATNTRAGHAKNRCDATCDHTANATAKTGAARRNTAASAADKTGPYAAATGCDTKETHAVAHCATGPGNETTV